MNKLGQAHEAIIETYQAFFFDLDGVVYEGPHPIEHAPELLSALQQKGSLIWYLTNNASRPPQAVAQALTKMGIPAAATEVLTSAQAAAALIAGTISPQAHVLTAGGAGLTQACQEVGLTQTCVSEHDGRHFNDFDAVLMGYNPGLRWADLHVLAAAVRAGLPFIATNADPTIPTAIGLGPGNGSLISLITKVTGINPVIAGKPQPPLLHLGMEQAGDRAAIMVGDRLDTDILGANDVGVPSLLVMTGVTTLQDLFQAPVAQRPSFVLPDLSYCHDAQPRVEHDADQWVCGHARVTISSAEVEMVSHGNDNPASTSHLLRAATVAAWFSTDRHGRSLAPSQRLNEAMQAQSR